ncbi:MAG: BRCT domain-containing protein, partial [Finegoldia magna]
PESIEKKLDNLTFVLTGRLVNYSRKELTDKLSNLGAKVSSSVSKNTDYVVYGEKAGSKLTKAKDLGVKLMTEDELNSFLDNL